MFDSLAVCRGRVGTILSVALICVIVFARTGVGAPVSIDTALEVARNLINHLNAPRGISSAEPVQRNGQKAGYLVHLIPCGYVLVAADDIRVPVKGYSLNSNFSDLPPAYVDNMLKELEVPDSPTRSILSKQTDGTNAPYWDYLLTPQRRLTTQAYTPDTLLVETQWNQDYPYNKLNPEDGDDLTLTGCVMTTIAQVMRYHSHPASGTGVFDHTWNSQDLTAVMNRPFNWEEMPVKVDGSVPQYQWDEVAALMRDLGILNEALFGTDSTGASFNRSRFERAFGYAPVYQMDMDISDPDLFFATIVEEFHARRPVILVLNGDMDHMAVADGYSSDGTGRNIHVNLGWGGAYDDYYYLDTSILIDGLSIDTNYMYYNIRPCEGAECDPYDPLEEGHWPVISPIEDMIIDGVTTIRLEAYDPDGDPVTLSASASCDSLEVVLTDNLLTMTPYETDFFCRVLVQAQSSDGSVSSAFDVLCLDEMIYLGDRFDIGGQFASQPDEDWYPAYLEGDVTISAPRGADSQTLYIWVEDESGDPVPGLGPDDEPISGNLPAGPYRVCASLTSGGDQYDYDIVPSAYILSAKNEGSTYTVADHAANQGISLTNCMLYTAKIDGGNGTVISSPTGVDCGLDCQEAYACGAEVTLTAAPNGISVFTGWSGNCSGTSASTDITVSGDTFCFATFEADYDDDEMPDDWEDANGLDSTIDDAWEDKDGDGVPNIEEYWAGTNPNDSKAMPWIQLLLLE